MSIAPSVAGTRDDGFKGKWNHWLKWDLEHEVPGGKKGHAWGEAGAAAEHAKGKDHADLPLPKVGKVWGKDRTAEYRGRDLNAEGVWNTPTEKGRYGTIVFDKQGRVLLREPKGHFSGMVWTFPKGHLDPGEHPVDTARRETLEETGLNPAIVGHLAHTYTGSTGNDHFYLAHVDDSQHPEFLNGETDRLTWATPEEAEKLLTLSTNSTARERDLWALHDAVSEHARLYPKVSKPMEPRTLLTVEQTVAFPRPPSKSELIGGHIVKAIGDGLNYDGIRAQAKAKGLASPYSETKANRDALRAHVDAAVAAATPDSREVALAHAAAKGFDDALAEHPDKPKPSGGHSGGHHSSGHYSGGHYVGGSTGSNLSYGAKWGKLPPSGARSWFKWDLEHPYQDVGRGTSREPAARTHTAAEFAHDHRVGEALHNTHFEESGLMGVASLWVHPPQTDPRTGRVFSDIRYNAGRVQRDHEELAAHMRGLGFETQIHPGGVLVSGGDDRLIAANKGVDMSGYGQIGGRPRAEWIDGVVASVSSGTRDWMKWNLEHPYQATGGRGKAWAAAGAAARKGTGKAKPGGPGDRTSRWTAEDHEVMARSREAASKMPMGRRFAAKRPMTADEFKAHRQNVERQLAAHGVGDLMRSPISTHNSEDRIGGMEGVYHPDRTAQHRQIIDEIMSNASEVPSERKALVTAGLGGAGKSTTLRKNASHPESVASKMGIKYRSYDEHGNGVGEPTNFITLNPDDIKEKMAERGMIPEVGDLSPMERSTFVHEEASHITHQLGQRAMAEGKNLIHDITLNSVKSGEVRLGPLREHGYGVGGVMVDVSPEHSAQNALNRHLHGQDRFNQGEGHGGRFVPEHLILGARDDTGQYRSKNRAAFEQMKARGMYDRTITVDNEGNAGRVIDETGVRSWQRWHLEHPYAHHPIRHEIDRYNAGDQSWADLLDFLATYHYKTPSHHVPGETEDDLEEADRDEPGTFGEVSTAHAGGKLSAAEFDRVVRAISPELHDHAEPDSYTDDDGVGARADQPMFSANGKLNGWWKWDLAHPGLGSAAHIAHVGSGSGHAWGHGWGEGAKEYWAEHAANKIQGQSDKGGGPVLPAGHFSAYKEGFKVGLSAGVKLGGDSDVPPLDSKQISDKAAPLYAGAKKAKDEGSLEEHAKLLGAAHGFKEASKAKASWEKATGNVPHEDVKGGKGKKVAAVAAVAHNAAEAAPEPTPAPAAEPEAHHPRMVEDLSAGDMLPSGHSVEDAYPSDEGTMVSLGHPDGTVTDVQHAPGTSIHDALQEHLDYAAAKNAEPPAKPPSTVGTSNPKLAGWSKWNEEHPAGGPGHSHEAAKAAAAALSPGQITNETFNDSYVGGHRVGHEVGTKLGSAEHGGLDSKQISDKAAPLYAAAKKAKDGDFYHLHATLLGAAHGFKLASKEKAAWEKANGVNPHTDLPGGKGKKVQASVAAGPNPSPPTVTEAPSLPPEAHKLTLDEHMAAAHAAGFDINAAYDKGKEDALAQDYGTAKSNHGLYKGAVENMLENGPGPDGSKKIAEYQAKAQGYADALKEHPGAPPSDPAQVLAQLLDVPQETPGPAVAQNPYPASSAKHGAWARAHDEALQHAKSVSMAPAQATQLANQHEVYAKTAPGGITAATMEGMAAGYHHHAANVNAVAKATSREPSVIPSVAKPAEGHPQTGLTEPKTEAELAGLTKKSPGETFSFGEKVPAAGSNGGQWYEDAAGHAYFLKGAQSDEHAMNEVAGSLAYQHAGVAAQKVSLVKMNNGSVRALSHYIPGLKPILSSADVNQQTRASARAGAGMDALMSHYDLTGLVTPGGKVDGPNLFKDAAGNVVRLDLGGTGKFRAQGGEKPTWKVGAWDNPGSMGPDYESIRAGAQGKLAYGETNPGLQNLPAPMKESMAKAATLDLSKYHQALLDAGVSKDFADQQAKVMADRQNHLLANLPEAAQMHGAKAAEPPAAAETAHDVFGVPVTPTEAKKALELYNSAPGTPTSPGNHKQGYGTILNALNLVQGKPEHQSHEGLPIHGTSYSLIHGQLQHIAQGTQPEGPTAPPAASLGDALQAAAAKEGVAAPSFDAELPKFDPAHQAHFKEGVQSAYTDASNALEEGSKTADEILAAIDNQQGYAHNSTGIAVAKHLGLAHGGQLAYDEATSGQDLSGKVNQIVHTDFAKPAPAAAAAAGEAIPVTPHVKQDTVIPAHTLKPGDVVKGYIHPPTGKWQPQSYGNANLWKVVRNTDATETSNAFKHVRLHLVPLDANDQEAGPKIVTGPIAAHMHVNRLKYKGAKETKWGSYGGYKAIPASEPWPRNTGVGASPPMVASSTSSGSKKKLTSVMAKNLKLGDKIHLGDAEPYTVTAPPQLMVGGQLKIHLSHPNGDDGPTLYKPTDKVQKLTPAHPKFGGTPAPAVAPTPAAVAPSVTTAVPTVSAAQAIAGTTTTATHVPAATSDAKHYEPGALHKPHYTAAFEMARKLDGSNVTNETIQEANKAFKAAPVGSAEEAQLKGVMDGLKQSVFDWEKSHASEVQAKKDQEFVTQVGKTYEGKGSLHVDPTATAAVPSDIPHGVKPPHATSQSSAEYDLAIAQGYDQAVAAFKKGASPEAIWAGRLAALGKADAMGTPSDNVSLMEQAHWAGLAQGAGKAAVDLKAGGTNYPNASSKSVIQHYKPQPSGGYSSHSGYNQSQSDTQLQFSPAVVGAIQKWKGEYVYSHPGELVNGLKKISKGESGASPKAKAFADAFVNQAEPSKQPFQRKVHSHQGGASWAKAMLTEGGTVEIPLTSWSTDPHVWSGDLWLHAPAGTFTMDIGKVGGLAGESETVTGGKWRVKQVVMPTGNVSASNPIHVYLEQIKPWAPPGTTPKAKYDVAGKIMSDAELQDWIATLNSAYGAKKVENADA